MAENSVNLEYIAARRKELGFTQGTMAEKLGMSCAPVYNKYEKGIYKFKAEIVPLLARTLQCEITNIFLPSKLTK